MHLSIGAPHHSSHRANLQLPHTSVQMLNAVVLIEIEIENMQSPALKLQCVNKDWNYITQLRSLQNTDNGRVIWKEFSLVVFHLKQIHSIHVSGCETVL